MLQCIMYLATTGLAERCYHTVWAYTRSLVYASTLAHRKWLAFAAASTWLGLKYVRVRLPFTLPTCQLKHAEFQVSESFTFGAQPT